MIQCAGNAGFPTPRKNSATELRRHHHPSGLTISRLALGFLFLLHATQLAAQVPPFDARYDSGFESGEVNLKPSFSAVLEGSLNTTTLPTPLVVRVSSPVPGDTFIPIVSSEPGRLDVVGGGATIPAGFSAALVFVNANTAGPAPVMLTATLAGNSFTAAVRVEKVLNETGQAAEMDNCATVFPPYFSVKAGATTPGLYARVYEAGVTDFAGPPGGWMVGAGYGPAGPDPLLLAHWKWFASTWNLQVGNDDEYAAVLQAPQSSGIYSFLFRMSKDGGGSWTYCDFDGAGSDSGFDFSPSQVPKMYVYGDDVRNGTGLPAEADYCRLQAPPSFSVSAGATTPVVFGLLFEAGVTEGAGAPPGWIAEVGFGPVGSDPRVPTGWTFTNAPYNTQIVNDDEFAASMQAPVTPGQYAYVFRVSQDSGDTWTYCDLDGAGSNGSLPFLPSNLGLMTVNPP
jgi:hypothetical protein